MTDIKRHFDDLEGSESPLMVDSPSLDDAKRQQKPGRKPIDNEPKSKRTAQNRAAQRAYRERKERKMKDLEDKVKLLEDQNVRINSESDFLKAQVEMLKNELVRYRGSAKSSDGSDFDFDLPQTVGKLTNPNTTHTHTSHNSSSNRLSDSSDNVSDSNNSNGSINDSSPDTEVSDNQYRDFPWSNKNNLQLNQMPDLVSGSSSSTSPLNENILMENQGSFDEKLDPFCNQLNEACGTKECPIPKQQQQSQQQPQPKQQPSKPQQKYSPQSQFGSRQDSLNGNSPFSLFNNEQVFDTDNFNFNLSTPNNDNDPLSFLNDNNFDINLAFDDNSSSTSKKVSPIDNLVSEESAYDPLKDQVNTNFNFNDFIKSSLPSTNPNEVNNTPKEEEEDLVVPAPEATFKCSEIWDRITAHPRYTEIDIDGLCSELKAKAKCSEKGVVINASDVNSLLAESAQRR